MPARNVLPFFLAININYWLVLFLSFATVAMFISGKYRAAVNIWKNLCLVRYRELLGTHPFTASLLHYIGDAYQKLGDPRRAVAFKKESLDMRKFLLGNWLTMVHKSSS